MAFSGIILQSWLRFKVFPIECLKGEQFYFIYLSLFFWCKWGIKVDTTRLACEFQKSRVFEVLEPHDLRYELQAEGSDFCTNL